ncbi:hypothetical protein BGX34_009603 [Mortierella sp. NVP85]|nr:hypothetical protein BGX34_009603 [Mortierella sp. NVP85]
MADIWFEFRRSDAIEGQEDNSDTDDEETIVDGDDSGAEVEVVGAHSRVLAQHPYFAAWIERERQKQEEQRRRQLEQEWRIHRQQQPLRQQQVSSSYQRRLEQREDEDEQLSIDVTMASGRALLGHSLPALRIPVQDISLQTFKILLQFIYTGQICVSQKQLTDIKSYWGENLEDYISPEVEACQQPDQPSHEGTAKQENPLGDMPPLFRALMQEHEHWQRPSLPALFSCAPFTLETKCPIYATAALSILQRHIPGSNHDPDPGCDPGPSSYPIQQREQGQGQEPFRYEYHGLISWETLFQAARRFGLRDLEQQAMKAFQYHSQMLNLRAIIDNDITAEITHDASDEPTLDLQLALGEQILRSIIRLYQCPKMMEREDGRVLVVDEQKGEEIEPSIIGGGSTNVDKREYQEKELSMTTSAPVGLRMPHHGTRTVPGQVRLVSPRARELVSQRSVTGSGDEENDQEERGEGGVGDEIPLFEGSACEEALIELCAELRERFLAMREIMQGGHQ